MRPMSTSRRLDCLRFQIPMRGNELCWRNDTRQSIKFQIPMRGNEGDNRAAIAALESEFQIPMRGNEL